MKDEPSQANMPKQCPYCTLKNPTSEAKAIRFGSFKRKNDKQTIQRYKCTACKKHFSDAIFSPCYLQKRRELNPLLFHFLSSGGTLRRAATLLATNRKTVARKLIFLGNCSRHVLAQYRKSLQVQVFEFDDLETFEHSKLKPLSVTIAIESGTRRVLGLRVSQMPAKGLLVKRSLKKYGQRKDERKSKRRELFEELQECATAHCHIKSDENPFYSKDVRDFFPKAFYETFKGRRGCVVGQGELKAGGFDPLFSLNHTYAMFRANMSRLFRRTWNTTKCRYRLTDHLYIYSLYHNLFILKDTQLLKTVKP